jgi:hypothetical protein
MRGGPARHTHFRVVGAIAALDLVVILDQHVALGAHQQRAERRTAGCQRLARQFNAAAQVLQIKVVQHGVLKMAIAWIVARPT